MLSRRHILKTGGAISALGVAGCAGQGGEVSAARPTVPPIRASMDRVFDITVCLRPFRAAGPRLDVETVAGKRVVHNYGHGGAGWSLSWGSSTIAVQRAMADSPRGIAVIGCGALGLTSALLAQQAGAQVTIYARERLPQTRSARATGTFTPDSRIALANAVAPDFAAMWEHMARISFKTYRAYLGLPGTPVEFIDHYLLADDTVEENARRGPPDTLGFVNYSDEIRDILPSYRRLPSGQSPFPTRFARQGSALMFNIADYGHTLMTDFLLAGGRIVPREFHSPADFSSLAEPVVINCTGYGARALWNDASIIPVRGQIAWLVPQPEVHYGIVYDSINVVPRRDGIVVQSLIGGEMQGYGINNEIPSRDEARQAVDSVARLFARSGVA